ncbi:universal stress protein [Microbulbifer celer]|uniref:Universal stress protein n=1 Tax=Microbulbifer celer TaxID=435905 RepID=A0ABW3U723_9GAMM|nr:universal stress protein [Microbulbifer celer]UFN58094.1 universal stress protein [Microbulbifer celer]
MSDVIACIDGSPAATRVCDYASWAAKQLDAPLTFLHVLDHSRYPVESNLSGNLLLGGRETLLTELSELDAKRNKLALEQGRLLLESVVQRATDAGVETPKQSQRHGNLVETLGELQTQTRLLVIGKMGEEHAGEAAQIGDHVELVLRAMHKPVLVVPSDFTPPKSFMIAFDGSPTCRDGVAMLASSPLVAGLPCHLVAVGGDEQVQEEMARAESVLTEAGHQVQSVQLEGEVEPTLHHYRQENGIDLVVMGAYGHSRIREFLVGSTTRKMITNAKVPHFVLR